MKIKGTPKNTSDASVIALMEFTLEYFIKTLKREKEIRPTFHLCDGAKFSVFMTTWANRKEKAIFSNFLHDYCIKNSIIYVIAVSDIWISKRKLGRNEKDLNKNIVPAPSDDPEREEGLLTVITYPNGTIDAIFSHYYRDKRGFPKFDRSPEWMNSDMTEFNLIKPWVKSYS